ncbi:hypothetical protein D3C81_2071810 [compost metagenome]
MQAQGQQRVVLQAQFQVIGQPVTQQEVDQCTQAAEVDAAGEQVTQLHLVEFADHDRELAATGTRAAADHERAAQGTIAMAKADPLPRRSGH